MSRGLGLRGRGRFPLTLTLLSLPPHLLYVSGKSTIGAAVPVQRSQRQVIGVHPLR